MSEDRHIVDGISLTDLLDISVFQNLTESFTRLTGIGTAILDIKGNVLTMSGWQKICTEYHRKHPVTAARCVESDTVLANQLAKGKKYNVYRCKNGLVDAVVPIVVKDVHVGNLFTGQFFLEPPDDAYFARQADEFGFDKIAYLSLLRSVPILTLERVEHALDFLSNLTIIIGNAGMDKQDLKELNYDLEKRIDRRTREITEERAFSDSLISSLPGVMYLFDKLGRFKRWNRNLEIVTGYTAAEIVELNPLDLFASKEEKQRIAQAIERVFLEGSETIEAVISAKDGRQRPFLFTGQLLIQNDIKYLVGVGVDITDRIQTEKEKEVLITKLKDTLSQVKQLSGFLPICASCKKIRDDDGYWNQIELYIRDHSEAQFSHSICPECRMKLYPHIEFPSE